ncbi:MAG: 50S ribosomal protein L11 methyltransferase [Bacteroidetes bacterium]|nr:50S ribosomal protein L11 methyltransferase [Bacteroidota bacterium]MDA1336863.1 50S ribosomal protein L11 methyltransferase [Bacteroidota bacterium]
MKKKDRFLQLNLEFNPVNPAKEIAVAWLDGCGFSMYQDAPEGIIAFAMESELHESEMEDALKNLTSISKMKVVRKWVESENWNEQWEAHYEPIEVEGRLTMRAPFHNPPDAGIDIIIQPEMSFGTGHHPTTWQMMKGLLEIDLTNKSVLDIGCGTGALAIAAKKMGADQVVAFDIDEWSFQNTQANVDRNALTGTIEIFQGNIASLEQDLGRFDVILANINRNVLIKEMSAYSNHLIPNGSILFSGFYKDDESIIREAAERNNLELKHSSNREDWSFLMFEKIS